MGLAVVGAGFARTGTKSLKLALEQLGFGPCHHMFEVFDHPEQLTFWQAAARGDLPDWDAVFADFGSCVDWPSARYWREIAAHYPDAKVVLSVRPAEQWINSIHATILPAMLDRGDHIAEATRANKEMANEIVIEQTFGGRLDDADHAMAVFNAHNAEVQRTISPERLLTYTVAEGWAPLCDFLGVAVPETPFPRTNTTEEFRENRLRRTKDA
jgi:hypothetical protein